MPTPLRPVTVSIVSHGHWGHIQPLLRQLATWCAPWIDRVILTVNVPEDLHIEEALAFPVDVVHNPQPRGFGANHNEAFTRVGTPWFLVLNPDLSVEEDVIGSLLARADADAGLIAPRVQEPGRTQPEPYRALVTPLELMRRRQRGHTPPEVPSWIAGMFMLLRTAAYREVQGFDERFFMYCEDVDLCLRLQNTGWKLQVATDTVVHHEAQRDSHSSLRALLWHLSSFVRLWMSKAFWQYWRMHRHGQAGSSSVLLCHAQTAAADPDRSAS